MNPDPNPNPSHNNPNNLFDTIVLLDTTFGSGELYHLFVVVCFPSFQ